MNAKARINWGAPGLTIVNVCDRSEFNFSHIQGAISMPMAELIDRALSSLELTRDIYTATMKKQR